MNQLTRAVTVLLLAGITLTLAAHQADASSDSTIVTIDPDMPDDFLNLYPDMNEEELAALPASGVAFDSMIRIGILLSGIAATVVATAMVLRRRETVD
jgi:hypothetical protein